MRVESQVNKYSHQTTLVIGRNVTQPGNMKTNRPNEDD